MGKSSSGKDTIYENLLQRHDLKLTPFIMYTTRPIRANETDGVQYHFVTEETLRLMQEEDRVIELRSYDTVQGIFSRRSVNTANSSSPLSCISLTQRSIAAIST